MNQTQIDYYQSLPEEEQMVLRIAALKAYSITAHELSPIVKMRRYVSEKQIFIHLENALKKGLLTKSDSSYDKHVTASPAFMIYIYPQLKNYSEEWKLIFGQRLYSYETPSVKNLRDYLYYLLYNKQKYPAAEQALLSFGFEEFAHDLSHILDYEAYYDCLKLINSQLLSILFLRKIERRYMSLEPFTTLQQQVELITPHLSPEQFKQIPTVKESKNLFTGNFDQARDSSGNTPIHFFTSAIELLLNDNAQASLLAFEKGLKVQRALHKGRLLPTSPETAFYYLTALLCIAPEESTPIFQKIDNALIKKRYPPFDSIYKVICDYALNRKENLPEHIKTLTHHISPPNENQLSLMSLLSFFLIDKQPEKRLINNCLSIIQKAFSNGYQIQAYEAAYVLTQWSEEQQIKALYDKIAGNFSFQPALSHISRQEEWEKSLNMFLSLGNGKAVATPKDNEGKYRVIYFVNFQSNHVQPILQSRTAKGEWTKGRNIALKTFYEAKVEGMTEQDYRIAKRIKRSAGYWGYGGEEYYFPDNIIKELVGHPYIFLEGSKDISVEVIAAQPVLRVKKTGNGYSLSTNIEDVTTRIIIEKETNTRYNIYDLNAQQRNIIHAIQQQKIVIPDQGKEKLMQVLGNFSAYLTVHSDLMATENTKVKKADADSRIRVQLLPLGDGLKAELFAKPFGSHPPYCKPGKGGKTLIANQQGEQLQVTRDLKQEAEFADALLTDIQSLESLDINDDLIAFDDPMDSLHLLDILAKHQDKSVVEWPEGERYKIKGSVNFGNLNLRLKSKSNWFELQGELNVDEHTVITIQQLLELTAKGHNRFIELQQGEFIALSDQLKKQLEELRTFSTASKDGVHINKFASVALGDFFDDAENLKTDKLWKEFRQRIEAVQQTDIQIPVNLKAELRPYQEEGFRWLSRLAEWEGGACLADDMGLGKTVQTLAILLHRAQVGAALVVCPVSVIPNWISETAKFAPTLNVKTLTNGNREETLKTLEAGDLLITSYGLLQSEEIAFANTPFATIVLDEAHTIKNYTTKTSKAAMQLQAPFRIALTGTPLQNHLGEIWNLFNFINPGLLGSLTHFTDTFIKPDDDHARKHLKKLITPFILRRTKSAVLDELPPKTEIIKKIQLCDEEMAYYEALRRQAIANLESDDSAQGTKHLKALAEITRLRQACCNPALVDPTLNISSSKLSTFLEIATELTDNKHRALVFSQFVTHLSLVRAALDKQGIKYQYLDGSSPMAEREQSVKDFQGGKGDLFLISLKAGGLGLNLTAADYVIHLDPWWNPAIEDQASDRAHRFGQTRPVTIYRLVAENTIEEKIIQLHNTKRDLAESLLEGSDQSAKLSITELVSLIKERD